MICTIHQPEHLPWLGFWSKLAQSDLYVVLDHVQFKRHHYECRNKIRNTNNEFWLTVDVLPCSLETPINKVRLNSSLRQRQENVNKVFESYKKAPYFKRIFPDFKQIYLDNYELLVDLNISLLKWGMSIFSVKSNLILSSTLGLDSKGSDLVLDICKKVGAHSYLSGQSGKQYLKLDDFKTNGINVKFNNFSHPVYRQIRDPFISNLSFIDFLMFNEPAVLYRNNIKSENYESYLS